MQIEIAAPGFTQFCFFLKKATKIVKLTILSVIVEVEASGSSLSG